MKKNLSVAVIVLLVVVAVILFRNLVWLEKTTTPSATSGSTENSSASQNSANVPAGADAKATSPDNLASRAASPGPPETNLVQNLAPLTVLDKARVAMHNYCSTFGENPIGDNAEIAAALMGNNPRQINFITPDSGLRLNEKGEMLDAWGTPFFFHQISGKEMEIHSAGEDRKMWTIDDQVTR